MLGVFHEIYGYRMDGVAMALAILLLVLMFPGVNRFGRTGVGVGIDIILSWAWVLSVLALLGYATNSLRVVRHRHADRLGHRHAAGAVGAGGHRHRGAAPPGLAARRAPARGDHRRRAHGHARRADAARAPVLRPRPARASSTTARADRVEPAAPTPSCWARRRPAPSTWRRTASRTIFITLPMTSQPRIRRCSTSCRTPRPRSTSCPTSSSST